MKTLTKEAYLNLMQQELYNRKTLSSTKARTASRKRLIAAGLLTKTGAVKETICSR